MAGVKTIFRRLQLAFAAGSCSGLVATKPGSPGYDHSFALAGEPTKTSKDKQTRSAWKKLTPFGSCFVSTFEPSTYIFEIVRAVIALERASTDLKDGDAV